MKKATIAIGVLLLLIGCKKDIQNESAVRDGILKYLSTRQGLVDMDVTVTSVSFQADRADATVHFQAKGNTSAGAGLDMKYVLLRKGAAWVVQSREGNGAAHGSQMPSDSRIPSGHPGMPASPGTQLPPGHPAVPSTPGAAPNPHGSVQ